MIKSIKVYTDRNKRDGGLVWVGFNPAHISTYSLLIGQKLNT